MNTVPLSEANEADLVGLARAQDQEAFEELMRRTALTSLRLALSIVRNREEAEDQVQSSFFNAWMCLNSFRFDSKFSTWIHRIVTNQSLMHLRSQRRSPLLPLAELELGDGCDRIGVAEPVDRRDNHETLLGRRELSDRLRMEIRKLPPLFRQTLELRDLQELPTDVVAARLGISEPAVKSRLRRARQLLRQRMEQHTGRLTFIVE